VLEENLSFSQVVTTQSAVRKKTLMIEKLYSHPELKNCPIDTAFRIIWDKWTILILREMFRNQIQFNRILQYIDGLTPTVLTQRMKTLRKLEIVERRIVLTSPIHIEYRLRKSPRACTVICRDILNRIYADCCF
jgi:DNA-binding HxlR family transcriptional regulator